MSNTPENRKCPCRHPDAAICYTLSIRPSEIENDMDLEGECDCNCHREYAEDAERRAELDFVLNLADGGE